jgi:hypothetical protein
MTLKTLEMATTTASEQQTKEQQVMRNHVISHIY